MKKYLCKDCIWGKRQSGIPDENLQRIPKHYECHNKPPVLTLTSLEEDCTSWPNVKPDDFCASWGPKES